MTRRGLGNAGPQSLMSSMVIVTRTIVIRDVNVCFNASSACTVHTPAVADVDNVDDEADFEVVMPVTKNRE